MWVPELWYLQTYRTCYNVFWTQCYFVLSINKGWSATCRDCKYGSVSKYHRVSERILVIHVQKKTMNTNYEVSVCVTSFHSKALVLGQSSFQWAAKWWHFEHLLSCSSLSQSCSKDVKGFCCCSFVWFFLKFFFFICFISQRKGKFKGAFFLSHLTRNL